MTVRLSDVDAVQLKNAQKLIEWLGRYKFFSPKKIEVVTSEKDRFSIKIYTNDNVYFISATEKYLGCTASSRKPRPGDDWTRGNDLPDGKFSEKTFFGILGSILFYEAKDVVRPAHHLDSHMRFGHLHSLAIPENEVKEV